MILTPRQVLACSHPAEFGLTKDDIFKAMKAGKLQYRQNVAHGNPYFRLLRKEVQVLAQDIHGVKGLEEQAIKHQLKKINREIKSLGRKLTALEKKKVELLEKQK